jgi:ribosomal protein S18 acetylase RimI-like enzyme
MSNCDTVEYVGFERWRELAPWYLDDNYQQSWAYGQSLARRHGAECEHVALHGGDETLGVASVRIRMTPVLRCGIAYVTGGPLTRLGRADDIERLTRCLTLLRDEYVRRRGLVLRVLAPVGSPEWNLRATAAIRRIGFSPTDRSRSYRTMLLDIDRPLDAIRQGCSKYWRRNLRRAERTSFEVRTGSAIDMFEPVRDLYEQLRQRKHFLAPFDADFFVNLQTELPEDERLAVTVVEHENRPVAGLVWSLLGDTCMPLLLAADESGLLSYAVYLLQWHSIVIANQRGIPWYDLGGIDPDNNVGVYNFKKGLRGLDLWAPGPFEAVPSVVRRAVTHAAEDLYRHLPSVRRSLRRPTSIGDALEPALPVTVTPGGGDRPQLRRADARDVDTLITICQRGFPNALRWQVAGGPARSYWEAALPSGSCETWVSVHKDRVQGFVVLVTDEGAWSAQRHADGHRPRRWLPAALRHPWRVASHLLHRLRRRRRPRESNQLPSIARTPQAERTWVELIAVNPQHRGQGVAADLLEQAETRTRQLNRHAIQLSVEATDGVAIRRYASSGYGLVRQTSDGLVLGKRMTATTGGAAR